MFSHLPDLSGALEAFVRVLAEDRVLVVSTHNPVHDYVIVRDREYPVTGEQAHLDPSVEAPAAAPTYAETERFDVTWAAAEASNRGTYYRRPIEGLFEPIFEAGSRIDAVVEPTFESEQDANGADDGRDYPPDSICLRATL